MICEGIRVSIFDYIVILVGEMVAEKYLKDMVEGLEDVTKSVVGKLSTRGWI